MIAPGRASRRRMKRGKKGGIWDGGFAVEEVEELGEDVRGGTEWTRTRSWEGEGWLTLAPARRFA
eukprot:1444286-Pyramimonas_sp.AAC.1